MIQNFLHGAGKFQSFQNVAPPDLWPFQKWRKWVWTLQGSWGYSAINLPVWWRRRKRQTLTLTIITSPIVTISTKHHRPPAITEPPPTATLPNNSRSNNNSSKSWSQQPTTIPIATMVSIMVRLPLVNRCIIRLPSNNNKNSNNNPTTITTTTTYAVIRQPATIRFSAASPPM